jgi:hypothetical protein
LALPAPQPPGSLAPPAAAAPLARRGPRRPGWLWRRSPLLEGAIELYSQDDVYPPRDPALILVRLGLVLSVLPIALSFFASLGILALVIIALGGGIVLAVFGAVIGAFARLVALIRPRRLPEDRKITQAGLVVQEVNGTQGAVVLYGDHIAGMLHKGDIVAVYGRRQRSGAIRAVKVEVVGAQFAPGAVVRRVVQGRRPFPLVIAIGVWVVTLIVWAAFYAPLIMRVVR